MIAPLSYFLFGRCVNADAAALLASLDDFGLLRTRAAAEAALALVVSFGLREPICILLK
jgi:hypothetical protein